MLLAAVDPNLLPVVLGSILGGGGLAAIFTYRKTSAEAKEITVKTMREVIDELRREIHWRDEVINRRDETIFSQARELTELRERVAVLETQQLHRDSGKLQE